MNNRKLTKSVKPTKSKRAIVGLSQFGKGLTGETLIHIARRLGCLYTKEQVNNFFFELAIPPVKESPLDELFIIFATETKIFYVYKDSEGVWALDEADNLTDRFTITNAAVMIVGH